MLLGQFQLQIFVSLVVILGAAIVALICDFLKRNNEQLREMNIELEIRHQEEQKRARRMTPRPAEPVVAAAPVAKIEPVAAPVAAAPKERSVAPKERKRAVNSEALAAMERGAALAGSGKRPPGAQPKPEAPQVIVVSQQETARLSTATAPAKKDWGSLLSRSAQKPAVTVNAVPVDKDLLSAVVDATNSSASAQAAELSLPAGFQDGFVLSKLVQSRQPVSGLVVSVGVNAARKSDGTLPESVGKLVQSLIGPNDFAAQSSEDEFLLIFPQERGASAQRRLSQIAQQLWDFQLRSLGTFQILFSWGGVEVRSESIEEAIASASERMQETKRGRKLLTMASPAPVVETQLRKAV